MFLWRSWLIRHICQRIVLRDLTCRIPKLWFLGARFKYTQGFWVSGLRPSGFLLVSLGRFVAQFRLVAQLRLFNMGLGFGSFCWSVSALLFLSLACFVGASCFHMYGFRVWPFLLVSLGRASWQGFKV